MAPSKAGAAAAPFEKEERVLCFHHDMLYEAKILDSRPTENNQSFQYRIHYKGWKNTVSLPFFPCFACSHRLFPATSCHHLELDPKLRSQVISK